MKIIRPITLTDAMLTSSNVAEDDYSEWAVGTSYTEGESCIVTTTGVHKIYEALENVTGGVSPEADVLTTTPKWLEVSATNRWKAFDTKVGTQTIRTISADSSFLITESGDALTTESGDAITDGTESTTSITYSITPGQLFDSIAFLNFTADSIRVVLTDPGEGVVYDTTRDLMTTEITGTSAVIDWYSYFFSEINLVSDIVFLDIPFYPSAVLDITIAGDSSTAKIGGIVFGKQAFLGTTQYSPTIGIHDYSIKEVDAWGTWNVVERSFSKRANMDIVIEKAALNDVFRILSNYRTTLLVWIGSDDIAYSPLIIYGFYKDFSIVISYPTMAICSIEIEGLT